uniref:Uncharacterized protein n=1 Tax=Setaria italica TaxID=4555 RepID=A0A0Q3P397_SETIT
MERKCSIPCFKAHKQHALRRDALHDSLGSVHTTKLHYDDDDGDLASTPSWPAIIRYLSLRVSSVHSNPSSSPIMRWTPFATSRLELDAPPPPPVGTGARSRISYHGAGFMRKKTESSHLCPLTVEPWNMAPPARTATGVTSPPAISAKSGLNRSRYGSRQVVPSGHTTRSPCSSSDRMIRLSRRRSRVSRTVGIGAISSEKPARLYVTAVTFRRSTVERITGSISVWWLHANNVPRRRPAGPVAP